MVGVGGRVSEGGGGGRGGFGPCRWSDATLRGQLLGGCVVLVRFTESTGACWSADSRSWCGPGRWAGASGSVRKYILSAEDLRAVW